MGNKSIDVKKVAKLANLNLSSGEINKFSKQLSSILTYISELDEVDTRGVMPTSQTTGLVNVTRSDEVKTNEVLSEDLALSGTSKKHNGYFVVPAILEK